MHEDTDAHSGWKAKVTLYLGHFRRPERMDNIKRDLTETRGCEMD